jgi:hypothetical protein
MTIARLEPIPTQHQYDHAYEAASAELKLYGGIRTHLANRALQVRFDPSMAEQDEAVAKLGVYFVDDTLYTDDDSMYEAAYAFTNGFMVANPTLDKLYKSPHTVQDRLLPVNNWLASLTIDETLDPEERLQLERQKLTEFGVYGTRQLGGVALAHLVEWSNQAYPGYERSAMMFCLGAGTAVSGAQMYQRQINAQLIDLMQKTEISYEDFVIETMNEGQGGASE